MSTADEKLKVGTIGWCDLTVPDAEGVRDFYAAVVGWRPQPVDMGDYQDFNMTDPQSGEPKAGVCHSRGVNSALPPVWMIYITVEDVEASAARCVELGGEVLMGPKSFGPEAAYCVIRDPAGAVAALYAQKSLAAD